MSSLLPTPTTTVSLDLPQETGLGTRSKGCSRCARAVVSGERTVVAIRRLSWFPS